MMFRILPLVLALGMALHCAPEKTRADYTVYVNPFIGTDGTGHTFPGPSMPLGMVQPGPDNRADGWAYTSGYQFRDSVIMGFSQTRANGTGINEFGDVLLMPFAGEAGPNFAKTYVKSSEKAHPGYYGVTLSDSVRVALTATQRVAFHRYTFPSASAGVLVDLQHGLRFMTDSLVLNSDYSLENDSTISGYAHTRNWVERRYFYVIRFDQPFISNFKLPKKSKENAARMVFNFNLKNKILKVKIALSTVDVAGAHRNMARELPGWDFATTAENNRMAWNQYLRRIEITGTPEQKTIFYTALYRLFLQPSNIADVDGRYRGANDSVFTAPGGAYYATLSLWDTYRAAHPLYTLIAPELVNDFVQSMLAHADAAGFLPIWTAWGKDNYCMIGNHAIPVITDAWLKGFRGFSSEKALKAMVRTTTENHINSNWTLLNRYGYYPFDSIDNEAVSRTLEHGVDDYCVALMAEATGHTDIAAEYRRRAGYYKNLYDPSTRQMRGKDSQGRWRTPFDPLIATSPLNNPGDYTEANAWQYFWTPAQYDVKGLTTLLGGPDALEAHLDAFFATAAVNPDKFLGQEAMIGQYAHGNEPSHHIAYLYRYTPSPHKTAALVARICREFYGAGPDGMIGNDDCGQMSAWYIFATLGFYPLNPANATFVPGMPQVKEAKIHLGNGKIFKIATTNPKGISLNGRTLETPEFNFSQIKNGGILNFENF